MGRRSDALGVMEKLWQDAPGWTRQQRYARDVMTAIIGLGGRLTESQRAVAKGMRIQI